MQVEVVEGEEGYDLGRTMPSLAKGLKGFWRDTGGFVEIVRCGLLRRAEGGL